MKLTIRQNVFETNSSSTHSLTMCHENVYQRWIDGELLYCGDSYAITSEEYYNLQDELIEENFIEAEKIYNNSYYKQEVQDMDEDEALGFLRDDEIYTYESFEEHYDDFERFEDRHDGVVAFGYFGFDG